MKKEKLKIGEPYSISVRNGNTLMHFSGDRLTKDDVAQFIELGVISKDDVEENKPEYIKYPAYKDFVKAINNKLHIENGFEKIKQVYPTIAFSIILKEYSWFANANFKGVAEAGRYYIIDTSNFTVKEINLDTCPQFPAVFLDKIAASKALEEVFSNFAINFDGFKEGK